MIGNIRTVEFDRSSVITKRQDEHRDKIKQRNPKWREEL